ARPLHVAFQRPHACIARAVRRSQGSLLCGEWCAFSRTFEAERASTRPADDVTFEVRDRHSRVVETCLDVRNAGRHNLLFFLFCTLLFGLSHSISPTVGALCERPWRS